MEIQTGDILAGRFSSGVRQTAESVSGGEGLAALQISTQVTEIQTDTFIDPKSSN